MPIVSKPADAPARRAEWAGGWRLPIAAGGGAFASSPHYFTLGLFLGPVGYATGWTDTQITAGMLIVSIGSIALAPVAGSLIDRVGARRVGISGAFAYALALAALSLVGRDYWQWLACWATIAVIAPFMQPGVWAVGVARSFDHARGSALAITMVGSSVAAIAYPPLAERAISAFGWQGAYLALATVSLAVVCALPLRWYHERPVGERSIASADGKPAGEAAPMRFATLWTIGVFWRLAICFLLVGTGASLLMTYFVPVLVERGLTRTEASGFAALIGAGNLIGKLGAGVLLDRVRPVPLACAAFLLAAAASCIAVGLPLHYAGVAIAAMAAGVCVGVEVDLLAFMASRYFGLRSLGIAYGSLVGVHTLGVGLGPPLGSLIARQSANYSILFGFTTVLFLVCVAIILTVNRQDKLAQPRRES